MDVHPTKNCIYRYVYHTQMGGPTGVRFDDGQGCPVVLGGKVCETMCFWELKMHHISNPQNASKGIKRNQNGWNDFEHIDV